MVIDLGLITDLVIGLGVMIDLKVITIKVVEKIEVMKVMLQIIVAFLIEEEVIEIAVIMEAIVGFLIEEVAIEVAVIMEVVTIEV